MKKYLSLLLLAVLTAGVSSAQNRETRDLSGFTGLSFGVAGTVFVEQGSTFSVVLEGDRDDLEEIQTVIRGSSLNIRHDRGIWSRNTDKITVYITMPEIENLSVSGSGKIIAETEVKADDLEMNVSGSGNIELEKLRAESVECGISGSGTIILAGSAQDADLSISGSGRLQGREFRTASMDVSISGSGSCYAMVEDELEASVSGSGDVYYLGDPRIDARISGSGKVRKLK